MTTDPKMIAAAEGEKCPFCGAMMFWSQGQTTEYHCNTIITETALGPNIGKECLSRQLAQQTELLGQALGILMRIEYDKELSPGPFCDLHTDIRSLIPALEKAIKVVK